MIRRVLTPASKRLQAHCGASPANGTPQTAIAALALALALTGCSTKQESPQSYDPQAPFESFNLSETDQTELKGNANKLVAQCAERAGLKLTLAAETPGAVDVASRMWAGEFGTLPQEHAEAYGYHAAPGEAYRQPFTVFNNEELQPQVFVIFGKQEGLNAEKYGNLTPPEGGCRTHVATLLGGDPWLEYPTARESVRTAAFADPESVAAMDEWVACMDRAGFAYKQIDEPVDSFLGRPLSRREKEVAVADVKCTTSSGWHTTFSRLQAKLQAQYVDDHANLLAEELAKQKEMLKESRALVGE